MGPRTIPVTVVSDFCTCPLLQPGTIAVGYHGDNGDDPRRNRTELLVFEQDEAVTTAATDIKGYLT